MRLLIFILISILIFACNRPDLSNYNDITDDNGNVLYKFKANDCTAVIFPGGKTYLMGKLVDLKREGIWKEYVIDGNDKCFEWTFKNDIENGRYYAFTATGKIELVGNKKDGALDGTFVYFDLAGKAEKVEVWKAVENHKGMSDLIYSKNLK